MNQPLSFAKVALQLRLVVPPTADDLETGLIGAIPAPPEITENLRRLFGGSVADPDPRTDWMRYLAMLTASSTVLTGIQGRYGTRTYAPAFYTSIVGYAGSNKSVLSIGRSMLRVVDARRRMFTPRPEGSSITMGVIVPADASSAGMRAALHASPLGAFILALEIDARVGGQGEGWKDTSTFERQAFEHEPIEVLRAEEQIIVERPVLAMLLAGTPQALLRELSTTEDGRFSRRLWVIAPPVHEWQTAKPSLKSQKYDRNIRKLAVAIDLVAKALESRQDPIEFRMTDHQWRVFDEFFADLKSEMLAFDSSSDIFGIIHRLGVIAFRLCVTVSALRRYLKTPDLASTDTTLQPTNEELYLALSMALVGLDHGLRVRSTMPSENRGPRRASEEEAERLLQQLPEEFSRGEAVALGQSAMKRQPRTTDKYLGLLIKRGLLLRHPGGTYLKTQPKNTP